MQRRSLLASLTWVGLLLAGPVLHAQPVAADAFVKQVSADVLDAVKTDKALVNHILTELQVSCLPADLPEAIEVDLSKLEKGHTLTLKDIALPKGVEAVLHGHSAEDMVLVSVVMPAAEAEAEAAPAAEAAAAPSEGEKK